jgi:hypothetical protein
VASVVCTGGMRAVYAVRVRVNVCMYGYPGVVRIDHRPSSPIAQSLNFTAPFIGLPSTTVVKK